MSTRGFLCLLVVVIVGFFLFWLVDVVTSFTATIDDEGSLWGLWVSLKCIDVTYRH